MKKRIGQFGPHPALGIVAARGLTFVDLGATVGFSDDHLSLVLRGVRPPSRRLCDSLSDALNIPAELLFHEVSADASIQR